MTAQEFGVPDLCSDNFDLLRFPSLSQFGTDNDDLNIMERMGSLFDPLVKTSAANPAQPSSQALQLRPQMHQPIFQSQTQTHATQPHPLSAQMQQSPAPMRLPQHHQMQSFPHGYVKTNAPQQQMRMQQMQTPFALNSHTSFDSEHSQQKFPVKSEPLESEGSEDQSDPDETYEAPRRSLRKRNATEVSKECEQQLGWHKPKKVGRPITYNGDPNAPELTEAERRRVKRRIANRESARRVQQRRKEMIDELQHKLMYVQHHHSHLMQHLGRLELEKGQLCGQLTELKDRWTKSSKENGLLTAQLQNLQKVFEQQQQQQTKQQGPPTPPQIARQASPAVKSRPMHTS